ncbi:MAG: hypothetical protein ABI647_17730 [Gemmatimonadota bacterium]
MSTGRLAVFPSWGLAILLFAIPVHLAAQVGHDPAKSPYRDLKYGQFVSFTAGYFNGEGGQIGVGPHDGKIFTLRHEFLADRPFSLAITAGYGDLKRIIADTSSVASRPQFRGPVKQSVMFAEGTFQLNLTGGKTWHSIAPYIGSGIGLAFASSIKSDSSGYKFSTKFYVAPTVGLRIFATPRLFIRLEARTYFWSLSYPATFRTDFDGSGPLQPVLTTPVSKEWVTSGVYNIGIGYAFHRPF